VTPNRIGNENRNVLTGTVADDWFQAFDGDDVLSGRGGNDRFEAGAGRDRVVAGKGNDTILGEAGADTLIGNGGADSLDGGEGDDRITGGTGNDTIRGGVGNDLIFGKGGADSIDGGEGDDTIHGGRNGDRIDGGAGNDLIHGYGETGGTSGATDTLLGGAGDDTVYGSSQADLIEGGEGDDVLDGNGGRNTLDGGAGDDMIYGDKGAEELLGGEGDDVIYADAGHDVVRAGEGADKVYGGSGNDDIEAGDDNDLVEAGEGNDSVSGGAGNDEMQGEAGNDTIDGGGDDGWLDWDDGDTGGGGGGGDTVPGGGGDTVPGGSGDTVPGGGGDTVPGGGGDTVPGGGGDTCVPEDRLSFVIDGGAGNPDVLVTVREVSGDLVFDVKVTGDGVTGDLRALFFHVSDEKLIGKLIADGDDVTVTQYKANGVKNLGTGANLNGQDKPTDIGVAFGTPGMAKDDIQQTSFTLSHTSSDVELDLSLLTKMGFVARLTSVGPAGDRERSLKLDGNAGEIVKVCPDDADDKTAMAAPTMAMTMAEPSIAPATMALTEETSSTPSGTGRLLGVHVGDDLYGNDGADIFVFREGDGVDMIWDFEGGRDRVTVEDYKLADVDLFTTTSQVSSDVGGGGHQRIVMVLDRELGDAIVFNDLGDPTSNAVAVTFADGKKLTVKELVARAMPDRSPVEKTVDKGDEVAATIKVVNAWEGGFQAELTVTATRDITDWDVQLGMKWSLENLWNGEIGSTKVTSKGVVMDVNDAGWNGALLKGESATFGFVATTEGNLGSQQVLDGIWIA
jgi:Ca2+-binding RTX toxin-like protein